MSFDPLESLRQAVSISPENVPLRRHLAETLLERGDFASAEVEFRQALARSPGDAPLQFGLARAFCGQKKQSAALVVLEELIRGGDGPAAARVLYARLLLAAGDVPNAVAQYKLGIERDPEAADTALAEQLGIGPEWRESELVEGRLRHGEVPEGPPGDEIERPKITFADVGGMEAFKEEIRLKIIYPLAHAEMYKAYGKAIGGGVLLFGPPGCGKTHLARATAGEIHAGFISVGIHDVLDMWIGRSEQNLHELFERGRQNAPCVMFFDEVDALGASRADMRASAGRHLINQFLAELDGFQANNDGLLILAATNSPWHVDPAFRRPGRFDRVLFVSPPDAPARKAILQILLKGKPQADVDFDHLAKKTDQFSGADLKAVIDLAVEAKLRQAMKEGRPKPLTTADLLAASGKMKPTTREWFGVARNYALYSNQGGAYDDILKYLKLS